MPPPALCWTCAGPVLGLCWACAGPMLDPNPVQGGAAFTRTPTAICKGAGEVGSSTHHLPTPPSAALSEEGGTVLRYSSPSEERGTVLRHSCTTAPSGEGGTVLRYSCTTMVVLWLKAGSGRPGVVTAQPLQRASHQPSSTSVLPLILQIESLTQQYICTAATTDESLALQSTVLPLILRIESSTQQYSCPATYGGRPLSPAAGTRRCAWWPAPQPCSRHTALCMVAGSSALQQAHGAVLVAGPSALQQAHGAVRDVGVAGPRSVHIPVYRAQAQLQD